MSLVRCAALLMSLLAGGGAGVAQAQTDDDRARIGQRIERAVVLSQEDLIDVHELSLSHLAVPGDTDNDAVSRLGPFVPTTIEEMERRHVLATLEAVGGNKTKAATILGIERSTLDRKLAKWARV